METIRELIARLATLTPDELGELRSQIVSEFERLDSDEATVEDIALLQELAGFGEQAMEEQSNREAAAAQAQQDRAAARERVQALNPPSEEEDPAGEQTPEAEGETEQTPAAEGETPAATEAVPEPVAAAGNAVTAIAARQRHPAPSPEAAATAPSPNRAVLTATGALRGIRDPNVPIDNRDEFFSAMAETVNRMSKIGPPRGDVILASATWQYPEDRRLGDSPVENGRKIDAVVSPQALTATGGICLPVNVDYSVPTWAAADRPLRDGLPSFEATRGGVRYVQPPDLGNLAAATGIWTEATDASPGALTKPIISIACGTEQLVYVEAISTRLGWGNMQMRFSPEQVAANTDLTMVAAARVAENNLLNLIAAQCVQNVTFGTGGGGTVFGATRDLVPALLEAVAAYRNAHRIPDTQRITGIFPVWLRDMLKADLAREIGHSQDSSWNALMITDQQVNDLIANTGVNPLWHLDGQPSSVSGGVAQTFGIQATGGIIKFPSTLVFYLFPEGMFQFLDGGRLDLGVVRDSTLDATNDLETFVETFEGVAFRGFSSGAIQYVGSLCANGQSAGTIASTGLCA